MADKEKRIKAVFQVDSTGFNNSLKNINSSLKNSQSELKLASEGIKAFGRDSEKLKSVQESLTRQIDLQSKKVNIYKDSIEKTSKKLEENIKTRDKLKDSLEKANKKYDEAVKLYGKESEQAKKAKEEVDKLTEEYKKKEKAVETNTRSIQNYETNMNKANVEMVKAQGELQKINGELDKSNNKWLSASEGLKKSSEKLKDVGGKISGVGDEILKLSAPIAATGVASAKLAIDFNEAMSKVATLIPGNQKRLQELKGDVQDVAIATGKSTDDIADGTYQVISAFGDASDTMKKVEIDAKAATAGMATTTDALNLSSAVMKGYGDTTAEANQKVMDMSFMTVKLGQTDFPSLASSIGKVVPLSNELKISQEEMFTVFATGTGVTGGASEVSTQYRGVLQSLLAPTKDMTSLIKEQGFADGKAMIAKKGLAGTIELITKKAKETNTPLQKYIGSIEGQTLALALAGEQSEVYKDKLEEMKNSSGAMEEAFNEQTNGINKTGFAFKQATIKMQVAGQKLGDAMAPILEKGAELFTKLADTLNNLSKEQLESYAKWGMMAVASGGALKILGGGISTIGNVVGKVSDLTGWLGKVSTASKVAEGGAMLAGKGFDIMGLATKASTLLMNPWTLAIAGVGIAGVVAAKQLSKEVVPSVDLFADATVQSTGKIVDSNGKLIESVGTTTVKISEGTKKAVGSYMEMDKGVTEKLNNLYYNSTTITDKNTKDITDKYAKMSSDIEKGMDTHYKKEVENMQKFFANSKNITQEEQTKILNQLKEHNNSRKKENEDHEARIKEILTKASAKKRELSQKEMQEINSIQEKMKKNAVTHLSEEEVQSKAILERLKQHTTRLTAEQASEVIKNAEKQRKGAVDKANKQYDETIGNIIRMRDETKTISADQADKLIKEAKRQKDESVKKADEMKSEVVKKVKEMNKETAKDVDENTGAILTNWAKLKRWWDGWHPQAKNFNVKQTTIHEAQSMRPVGMMANWTGTNFFKGGLTTLHERGEEIYDLPRGTRIYNAERSEQLVMQTAERVAEKVASRMLKGSNGASGVNVTQNIYSPTASPSEVARQTKNSLRELALNF